jgi:hypothetical protein
MTLKELGYSDLEMPFLAVLSALGILELVGK